MIDNLIDQYGQLYESGSMGVVTTAITAALIIALWETVFYAISKFDRWNDNEDSR